MILRWRLGDYTATSGTAIFAPGVTTQSIQVSLIADTNVEPDERFTVNLTNPANATVENAQGIGVIFNDDPAGLETALFSAFLTEPNPSMAGEPITYHFGFYPFSIYAFSGTMLIMDGKTVIGSGTCVCHGGDTGEVTLTGLSAGTHYITAYYQGDPNHTSAITSITQLVTASGEAQPPNVVPADLTAQLRVSPDREFGLNTPGDNTLTYNLTVQNVGPGKAHNVSVHFPINPALTVGYVSSDDAGVWVQQIVTDTATPYIQIAVPDMDNGASHSVKVVMRAGANATAGSTLSTTYAVWWDDASADHRDQYSNGVSLKLTGGSSDRDDTDGAVQLYNLTANTGSTITISGDFYAPSEGVDLWYTDASNHSTGLGRYKADANGNLTVTIDASSWPAGSYVIAGRGIRSDITGAIALNISASTSTSHAKTISVNSLSSTILHSLTDWHSSK